MGKPYAYHGRSGVVLGAVHALQLEPGLDNVQGSGDAGCHPACCATCRAVEKVDIAVMEVCSRPTKHGCQAMHIPFMHLAKAN